MKFFKALFGGKKEGSQYSFYAPKQPVVDDDIEEISATATRKRRDGLTLTGAELSQQGLAKLVESMPSLRALRLERAALDDDALAPLAGFEGLEFLDLTGVPLNGSCLVAFDAAPALWYLNLRQTRLVDMALLGLGRFPKLHTLDVSATRVTQRGLPYCSRIDSLCVLRAGELGLDDSIRSAFADQKDLKVEL